MIRQKKSKMILERNSIKFQEFEDHVLVDRNKSLKNIQKSTVFQDGIINQFFNLNINAENPLNYTKNGRKRQLVKSQRPFLLFKQDKNKSIVEKRCENKQKKIYEQKPNCHDKLTLIQTTGNLMLSLKSFKKKEYISRLKRPISSVVNSVRSSMQLDGFDNSISQILGEIKNQQANNTINKDKISTSKALQMFSKIIRSSENTSREMMVKRINNNNSQERYRSVSVLANKVKIEHKNVKQTPKVDFKTYLKKFKNIKNNKENKQNLQKDEDFHLQGWDTTQNQMI